MTSGKRPRSRRTRQRIEPPVGYTPERDYRYIEVNRNLRRLHPNILANVVAGIEHAGADVVRNTENDLLTAARSAGVGTISQ